MGRTDSFIMSNCSLPKSFLPVIMPLVEGWLGTWTVTMSERLSSSSKLTASASSSPSRPTISSSRS